MSTNKLSYTVMKWDGRLMGVGSTWTDIATAYAKHSIQTWMDSLQEHRPDYSYRRVTSGDQYKLQARLGAHAK